MLYPTAGLLRDLPMKPQNDEIPQRKKRPVVFLEALMVFGGGVGLFVISARFDLLERIVNFSRLHEDWQLDELITVSIYFMFALLIISFRGWREVVIADRELKKQTEELQRALGEIRQLKGIIPICSSCKKIRDDQGFWHQVESYLQSHSDAEFSHGICPDCVKKLYPDLWNKKETGSRNPEQAKSLLE